MGRYSSVQAYADNHTGVRKVPYEQAAAAAISGDGKVRANVKPEKVVNPYGSTAGAGSGDFHVYRHARNRELQRQQRMDLSAAEQEEEELFQREQAKNKEWEEERTAKRRKKRERQKNTKKRKLNLAKAGINMNGVESTENQSEDDEFQYTPGEALAPAADEKKSDETNDSKPSSKDLDVSEIPNDGSFLEMMKQKLQQAQQKKPPGNQ